MLGSALEFLPQLGILGGDADWAGIELLTNKLWLAGDATSGRDVYERDTCAS
jgi:hypothetical protein